MGKKNSQIALEDVYDDIFNKKESGNEYDEISADYLQDTPDSYDDEKEENIEESGDPSFCTNHGDENQIKARSYVSSHYKTKTAIDFVVSAVIAALTLIIPFVAVLFLSVRIFNVTDDNMAPSLTAGNTALVNILAYQFRAPARGDVVVVNGEAMRVLGLPGEEITLHDDKVYADGKELVELYYLPESTKTEPIDGKTEFHLAGDQYFLLYDNRNADGDSRTGATVSIFDITGKIIAVF